MTIGQIAGILPAVVFPAATALQLVRIIRSGSALGVSATTWSLFGIANIAMYVYAERYTEWQAIVGMLLTAVIDFVIAALAIAAARGLSLDPLRTPVPAATKAADKTGACSGSRMSQPAAHEREEEVAAR